MIGDVYRNGNFHQLKNYTFSLLNLQFEHGDEYKYKKKDALYRGVREGIISIDDYKINNVHFWPTLTSSSKSLHTARQFS